MSGVDAAGYFFMAMPAESDSQLLSRYILTGSEEAFSCLVRRHVDLVYSLAVRATRSHSLAEDVTQAVFIVLAKKARSVRNPALLPAWLMTTTRYVANNARRHEARRQNHEQKASAMKSEILDASQVEPDLLPLLDESLALLSDTDRTAVVLRYLHNKTARQIGDDLGLSEPAAQKRIVRALDKIRLFLSSRGVTSPADAIELALAQKYLQAAPESLVALISAGATGGAATSASALAHSAIKALFVSHVKFVAAASIAAIAVLGTIATVIEKSPPSTSAANLSPTTAAAKVVSTTAPVRQTAAPATTASTVAATLPTELLLPNDSFQRVDNANTNSLDIDDTTVRAGGETSGALLFASKEKLTSTGTAWQTIGAVPFTGKRVRFSAYVKTDSIKNKTGLVLAAYDQAGHLYNVDEMMGRTLAGTNDWKKLEIVSDIDPRVTGIYLGLRTSGPGDAWLDGAKIEVVDKTVPTTDDSHPHMYTSIASNYSAALDPNVQRNGHPTFCVASGNKPTGSWAWWGLNVRDPAPYLGKKIRVSAWIKTERVTGLTRLSVWATSPEGKLICIDNPATRQRIKGTTDWTHYEIICDVPADLQHMDPGLNLFGNGKVWIDEWKWEPVGDEGNL